MKDESIMWVTDDPELPQEEWEGWSSQSAETLAVFFAKWHHFAPGESRIFVRDNRGAVFAFDVTVTERGVDGTAKKVNLLEGRECTVIQ